MCKFTRKIKREKLKELNPFNELFNIINQYFPNFFNWLDNLTDTRNQAYITYELKIAIFFRILAICSGSNSMCDLNRDFNTDEAITNINFLFNKNYIELPHKDTLRNIINDLKHQELEKIQLLMIKRMIQNKMFDKFRYNGMFHIVIDGTGLYSSRKNLGEKALTKKHNKDTDQEYIEYFHYVLEAKIICGNLTFSFASEFVENETYIDKNGVEQRRFDKQDCELKAAYRLLDKIKKNFPRLPIVIGADALYMGKPFINKCKQLNFEYIIRCKKTEENSLMKEFNSTKTTSNNYSYSNEILYGEATSKDSFDINVIEYNEEFLSEKSKKQETREFTYITSLKITDKNKEELIVLGRKRWKIENKGFKDQKSSDAFNITHIFTKDGNGTQNTYLLIQIAHTFINLLNYGHCLISELRLTKKEVMAYIKKVITSTLINLIKPTTIQLRFP